MLLSVLVVGVAVAAPPQGLLVDDVHAPGCEHAKRAAVARTPDVVTPPVAFASNDDNDVLHYHLDIELKPQSAWLGGSNTMTVESLVDGLDVFRYRLDDVFVILDVTVDGVPADNLRIDDANLEVTLDPPRDAGEVFEVYVEYVGFPVAEGFGSIVFRDRNGAAEAWTLSEPWFAHTWWPGKDDNRDKATADLWITVPDDMTVASNGVLMAVDLLLQNKQRFRWRTDYPTADYLYCFGATNYNVFGETWTYEGGTMPLDFYIYPEADTPEHREAWLLNLDMLDVFSGRYGLYPFVNEKYGMCQVGFGGGMEHQTMTSQGGFWQSITAHELAHQWYGDLITCATWHDIWLNEGFATFSEAIWFGEAPGGGGMDAYHARMEQRRPSAVDDSVYVYDISDPGRIFSGNFTYRKGAWVVHMLRHVLGDDVFFDVLAGYRDAFGYASATTADFQGIAESVSDRDLDWFFEPWIYDIGAPAYRFAWRAHEIADRDYVELYLAQVQDPSFPIFSMPLDVHTDASGGEAIHVVWNDEAAEHLLFEVEEAATALQLDPRDWTLHTSNEQTAFVEGPPKVAVSEPAPGASIPSSADMTITVVFHKDVLVEAGHVTLEGAGLGVVETGFSYDAATFTVTLTPLAPLPADTYTLRVEDDVVDVAAGLALDGEVEGALPSGDGLPGGATLVQFAVSGLVGDFNGDGMVDGTDLGLLLANWGPCPGCPFDLDGDDEVGGADLGILLANWS